MKTSIQTLDKSDESVLSLPESIELPYGMPGFPGVHQFTISPLGPGMEPFLRMESVDPAGLVFVVVPPGALFPDYSARIDEEHVEGLGITGAADAGILAIVTLGVPPKSPTVNLLGPLVLNLRTGKAAQVVQHGSEYPVAAVLVGAPEGSETETGPTDLADEGDDTAGPTSGKG